MSVAFARLVRDFDPADPDVAALARSLAGRSRRTPVDEAAMASGLRGKALRHAIDRAEAAGLIERGHRASGPWLRLARLGESLFAAPAGHAVTRRTEAFDDAGDHAAILAELANATAAIVLAEDLARRMGIDVADAWEALEAAGRAGWVQTWPDAPQGPAACLSATTAGRLGLALSADGSIWLRPGEPDPTDFDPSPCRTESDCTREDGPGLFDDLADPQSLEGLDSLALVERIAREAAEYEAEQETAPDPPPDGLTKLARAWVGFGAAQDEARLPRPLLILGLGPAWPVAWTPGDGPCPGCGSRPLGIAAYCLVCHGTGLDRLLTPADPLPADPAEAPTRAKGKGQGKITVPARFRDRIAPEARP